MLSELVAENPDGMYHLTDKGWNLCRNIHDTLKSKDQWWPEETIDEEKLEKVLSMRKK